MNVSGKAPDLILIFTGSSRDKLAHLVMNSRMPFYGSQVTPFPLLDRSFSDEFTRSVNRALAAGNQLEPEAVYEAFVMVGHSPGGAAPPDWHDRTGERLAKPQYPAQG